jgi:hypothetical protein
MNAGFRGKKQPDRSAAVVPKTGEVSARSDHFPYADFALRLIATDIDWLRSSRIWFATSPMRAASGRVWCGQLTRDFGRHLQ